MLTCILLLIDQALLHLFRVCHVPSSPIVRLLRLHSKLNTENHVTSSSTAQIVLVLQKLCSGVQVKERLVAEVRLAARMTNEHDLGHRVEVEE